MIRYAISPVIGVGTEPDPQRAKVSDYGANVSSVIPTFTSGPNIGKHKYNFCICMLATANLNTITSISNVLVFPDYPLDARMDGMESQTRTDMISNVQAYDLDGAGLHFSASIASDDAKSYREFLTSLCGQLESGYQIGSLNVGEVAA